MPPAERAYFKRRAYAEIQAAMRADCAEASISHVKLAELHMARCADGTVSQATECSDCSLTNICPKAVHADSHATATDFDGHDDVPGDQEPTFDRARPGPLGSDNAPGMALAAVSSE